MVASCSMALSNMVLPGCCRLLSGGLCCTGAEVASAAEGWTYRRALNEGTGLPRASLGWNNRENIWLNWSVSETFRIGWIKTEMIPHMWCNYISAPVHTDFTCTDQRRMRYPHLLVELQARRWCQIKAACGFFCYSSPDQSPPGTESVDQRQKSQETFGQF